MPWPTKDMKATLLRRARQRCKTHENTSAMQTQDVLAIVRGAFRALKVSQAGGWHVVIRPSGIKGVIRVSSAPYRPSRDPFDHDRPFREIKVSLPSTKMDKAAVNAFAGEVMAALDAGRSSHWQGNRLIAGPKTGKPWWQQDSLWCDGMEVRLKPVKPKPTTAERVQERESHARKMLARAERDAAKMLARAERDAAKVQARVDRWQKKVTYYDNRKASIIYDLARRTGTCP